MNDRPISSDVNTTDWMGTRLMSKCNWFGILCLNVELYRNVNILEAIVNLTIARHYLNCLEFYKTHFTWFVFTLLCSQLFSLILQNLKQAKSRRDQFSQGGVSSSLPPSAMSGHHHGSVLLADEQVSIDLSNHEPSKSLMQTQALVYDETVSFLILFIPN